MDIPQLFSEIGYKRWFKRKQIAYFMIFKSLIIIFDKFTPKEFQEVWRQLACFHEDRMNKHLRFLDSLSS